MQSKKSLVFASGAFAIAGALLVVACSDDSTSNTSNPDSGTTPPPTPGSSGDDPPPPNNPPPNSNVDGGDGGGDPLTDVALGGACTAVSDTSTECTSGVCYMFGGGGGGGSGGGGGGAKKGTLCTQTCENAGMDDPSCDADVFTGKCNDDGYCVVKK